MCSEDATATLFDCSNAKGIYIIFNKLKIGKITYTVKDHKQSITDCDMHPLGYLAVVCSLDE